MAGEGLDIALHHVEHRLAGADIDLAAAEIGLAKPERPAHHAESAAKIVFGHVALALMLIGEEFMAIGLICALRHPHALDQFRLGKPDHAREISLTLLFVIDTTGEQDGAKQ